MAPEVQTSEAPAQAPADPTGSPPDPPRRRTRWLVWLGLAAAIWMALDSSADSVPVSRQWVEERLATPNEDIRNLYIASSKAEWSDVPRWFVGNWNYPGIGYYRPLTSILYLLEYRAFDRDFTAYNRVTWLLNALNTALLFLLVVSLFRDKPVLRVILGLIAAAYFSTRLNSMVIGVRFSISWWAAQNDVLSLTFALAALLALDQFLVSGRRMWLAGALLGCACSIGAKEMGYGVIPAAAALVWYRRGRPTPEMAAFLGMGVFFWVFRKLVVANPWAENYFTDWVLRKAAFYWGGPVFVLAQAHIWWPIIAALVILITLMIGLKRGWSMPALAVGWVISTGLCAQFLIADGTWALLFVGNGSYLVLRSLAYLGAIVLFWRYRRVEPGLFAMASLMMVFVPILQFAGYHYLYWPGAFLAMANACFCACLLRFGAELIRTANWTLPFRSAPTASPSRQA